MNSKRSVPHKLTSSDVSQILLGYLQLCYRSKENEDQQSENRIKTFFAITAAIIAVFGYLFERSTDGNIEYYAVISLSILFAFGMVTFARVIWRGRHIDHYDTLIRQVSSALKRLDPVFNENFGAKEVSEPQNRLLRNLKGTHAQYLYIAQATLSAGLILILCDISNANLFWRIAATTLTPIIVVMLMFQWSQVVRRGKNGGAVT